MEDKVDKRVYKTLKRLKISLVELLVTKNIEDISIVELTNNAQVNRKTFYLHYSCIEDVLKDIQNSLIDKLNTSISTYDLSNEKLSAFISECLSIVLNDEFSFNILKHTKYNVLLLEDMINTLVEGLNKKNHKNNLTKSSYTIEFYVYGGVRLFSKWIKSNDLIDEASFALKLTKIMLDGLN